MEENLEIIKYINIPLGIFSLTGCLLIILTFIIFEDIRSFVLEMVFYLAFSCFMHTLAYIIYFPKSSNDSDEKICKFQAFIMLFFGDSQFIWTSLISYSIFQSVINLRDISAKNYKCKRLFYIFIGFGIPLLFSFTGYIIDIYGVSGFWCYISQKKEFKFKFFLILNYVFLWICIFLNFIFYITVIKYIKKHFIDEEDSNKIKKIYIYSLISYFLIQIICILPGTINRLFQSITDERITCLDFIQSIFDCSQGLAYSVVYGFNPTVKESLRKSFNNIFKITNNSNSGIDRKETEVTNNSLKSNIDFTRISLIDKREETLIYD